METLELAQELSIVKLNVTDQAIAEMKSEYLCLTVNGIEDKSGLKKVYDSRQIVKKTRVGVVKYANELKEKAIAWQKKVNTEKDRVCTELEAVEEYLQSLEDNVAAEKKRIEDEKESQENQRIQKRMDQLSAYGDQIDYVSVRKLDDATFQIVLDNAKIAFERDQELKAEAARQAEAEAARLKAEREELEKLRAAQAQAQAIIDAENERIRKEQEEKQAAILAEQKRILDEKAELEREKQKAIEIESAKEAVRLKLIADQEKEASDKIESERLAKIEADRQLALRPDKEKLQAFSDSLGQIKLPEVSEAAQEIVNDVQIMINRMQAHIIKKIKTL